MEEKTGAARIDAEWVAGVILDFWGGSPANCLGNGSPEKAWDEPLVGFADGADPLFDSVKADIGPFYWTPLAAFRLAYPDADVTARELTVVSWVLPQTAATRCDQSAESDFPAERWARSRDFGERFNCQLRLHLAAALTEAGHPAVAPERLPGFDYRRSERFGIASNWSERHAAYIAGLGTFGLSDGLITRRGKAVRLGSVVARLTLPPTPRPYQHHQEWCLFHARGVCGACIGRCPADAIGSAGHDKDLCFGYIREVTAPLTRERFGTSATPCGLCQVRIPCEDRNPLAVAGAIRRAT